MTDFTTAMDKLAAEIAAASCNKDGAGTPGGEVVVPLGDKIDAFKALMPYYTLLKKRENEDDPDDDTPTFDNFQSTIHAAENLTRAAGGAIPETTNGTAEPGVRGHSGRTGSRAFKAADFDN